MGYFNDGILNNLLPGHRPRKMKLATVEDAGTRSLDRDDGGISGGKTGPIWTAESQNQLKSEIYCWT
jgi:hypothetical protein